MASGVHTSSWIESQGKSVGSGEKPRRKFSSTGRRAPGYRHSLHYFQTVNWPQKMLCIIVPNRRTASSEFFSCVRTRQLLSRHTYSVRSPRLGDQGKLSFSTFLTGKEGTPMTLGNIADANSRAMSICTDKILFLTDHKVS